MRRDDSAEYGHTPKADEALGRVASRSLKWGFRGEWRSLLGARLHNPHHLRDSHERNRFSNQQSQHHQPQQHLNGNEVKDPPIAQPQGLSDPQQQNADHISRSDNQTSASDGDADQLTHRRAETSRRVINDENKNIIALISDNCMSFC